MSLLFLIFGENCCENLLKHLSLLSCQRWVDSMSKIPRAGLLMELWLLKQGSVSFKIAKKRGVRELDVSHSIQLRESAPFGGWQCGQ